ncbi:MAG: response regulator [Anaerolineae bacterium]|jgi:CheY-like chemotaxis protein|nr:response regulator [Anaerolineae bacterium]
MAEKRALVVDDNPANRDFLERLMSMAGFQVSGAMTGQAALDACADCTDLKLALIDMELPDMNGIQLTSRLREMYPKALLVVATMHDERSLMESVFLKGGNIFLVKPHGFMELFKRLTTVDLAVLREAEAMVIDQYGPRPFFTASSQV